MRVPRIVISTDTNVPWQRGTLVSISKDSFHHLAQVLRIPKGAKVELISSDHGQSPYYAIIESIGETKLLARLESPAPVAISPKIILLCGMPKGPICDTIVQKAVELGLAHLKFFCAQRTQGRFNTEQRKKRLARFNRIRDAALKQSGAQEKPTIIDIFDSLPEALISCHGIDPMVKDQENNELRLILAAPTLDQCPIQAPIITNYFTKSTPILSSMPSSINRLEPQKNNAEIYVIVGPEGGLTEEEFEISESYSYQPASLGQKTLRSDTAVVGVLSILNTVF